MTRGLQDLNRISQIILDGRNYTTGEHQYNPIGHGFNHANLRFNLLNKNY
jgi:hypothetical protein